MASSLDHFRVRNDDGTEVTATWKAAQDSAANVINATTFRIRNVVSETGSNPVFPFQWEANKNGGAFSDVTTVSANIKAVTSGNVADTTPTTSQLTDPLTFLAGEVSADGVGANKSMTSKSCEQELICQTVGAVAGDVFVIRIKGLGTYNVTSQVSIASASSVHGLLTLGVG